MENVASLVIIKCGGADAVAGWLKVAPVTVYRWTYPKSRGGTGGRIPTGRQQPLMDAARKRGINLVAADFFAGAS